GEYDDTAFFQMPNRAPADVGFRHRLHRDCRKYAGWDLCSFEGVLERERIDDSCQHPHLVGGRAVHPARFILATPQHVSCADDESELNSEVVYFLDLESDLGQHVEIDTAAASGSEGFARKL